MVEAECPYCGHEHAVPTDMLYGGVYTTPCGHQAEVEFEEHYDEHTGDVWQSWSLQEHT